jgi:serine/threonine protein kinase
MAEQNQDLTNILKRPSFGSDNVEFSENSCANIQFTEQPVEDKTKLIENFLDLESEKINLGIESRKIENLSANSNTHETVIESHQQNRKDQSDMPVKTGDVLNNRYQLEEQIGIGGMGSVFKALDLTKQAVQANNHNVAIKALLPIFAKDSVLVTGFHREAEKAQRLTHPNIIKVFDANRDGDRHYIVMEYLQGTPLNRLISDRGAMPLKKAWPLIRGMGRGLAHAHEENIIHSDFKPGNVFLVESTNQIKILDFGIASELKKSDDKNLSIFDPRLFGALTTCYASFEILSGAKTADQRDDIYSFGLVVYELLTGKHPYNRKTASEIYLDKKNRHYQSPLQPTELSKTQWQLLSQAIAIEQEDRPSNLQKWLEDFDPNRNLWKKWLVLAIALATLLTAGSYFWLQPNSINKAGNDPKTSDQSVQILPSPPIANAGNNQQTTVGQTVTLDGKASESTDAGLLIYAWQLLEKPELSISALINSNTATPQLIPDKSGLYRLKLIVTDAYNQSSQPALVMIDVTPPALKLNLKTNQSKYYVGQYLHIGIQPPKNGYLGLVYISSTGEKLQVFPNPYQKKAQVKANQTYEIPPKNKPKMLEVGGPEGIDSLVAVFSENPLPKKLESHLTNEGNLTGLQQNISTEKAQYQVIHK